MATVRPRRPGRGSVVTGTTAAFGILVSSVVLGVAVAGALQWGRGLPPALDNALPLVVILLGLVLAGRVAVDVAGHRAPWCALGTALVVGGLGAALSRSSEAHGDGVEAWQVVTSAVVVLVVVGASTWVVLRRRRRHA